MSLSGKILEDLGEKEFERFKWYLEQDVRLEHLVPLKEALVLKPDRENLLAQSQGMVKYVFIPYTLTFVGFC